MRPRDQARPVVLVAEESAGGEWRVSRSEAELRVGSPAVFPAGRWEERLTEWLATADPAPVRAIVLLRDHVEAVEYPVTRTLLPCPVVQLPRLAALAAFAPQEWTRFAVVDPNESGRCGLVTRSGANRFFYAESRGGGSGTAARDFGYECAVVGGTGADEGFPDVRRIISRDRLAAGAAWLAISALELDGVCRGEAVTRPVLRLACRDSAAYDVVHTAGAAFDPSEDCVAQIAGGRPVLLAVDANVMKLHGRAIREYAGARLAQCGIAVVYPGDASKSWSQVAYVCEQAQRAGLPRHGVIAGVGGGVTLDIAGLAASLYYRGVRYLRVPTTLLAMVDVAVGIKHSINFCGKKSLLGAFYPAIAAINDFTLLKTLPKRELVNGFSEIIKLGMVRDRVLFDWVEQHGERLIQSGFQDRLEWGRRIVLRAEYVLMADLQPNLYESDARRFPDFGHTFSGALEEASDYLLPHGEAVAIDILLSTILAVRRQLCAAEVLTRLVALYRALGLLALPRICTGEVLADALRRVRLQRGGQIHMVLPSALGEGCFVEDITPPEACGALDKAVEICAAPNGACHAGAGC